MESQNKPKTKEEEQFDAFNSVFVRKLEEINKNPLAGHKGELYDLVNKIEADMADEAAELDEEDSGYDDYDLSEDDGLIDAPSSKLDLLKNRFEVVLNRMQAILKDLPPVLMYTMGLVDGMILLAALRYLLV